MDKYFLIFSFLLVGCGGSNEDPSAAHEILGRWKTDCFTDDAIDYWVTTEYVFTENNAQQIVFIYEDESCTVGIGNTDGGPVVSEGEYFFVGTVVTSEGLAADLYGQYFLSRDPNELSELGVFIDNDILYLVSEKMDGYHINFEIPFFRNEQ